MYDASYPSDHDLEEVILGTRTQRTQQGYEEAEAAGRKALYDWLRNKLGCTFTEDIKTDSLGPYLKRLANRFNIAEEPFRSEGYAIYHMTITEFPRTPMNTETIHLSPEDRSLEASLATEILFIVAVEFIRPDYGAALIEARDPKLAQDIKDFFKQFARQLKQVRPHISVMPDNIFEELTKNE